MSPSGITHSVPNSTKGIRLLSLDGGPNGIPLLKTIKSLCAHVLDEKNRLRTIRGEPEQTVLPKPSECFEIIGGSGSGGMIALMIGPLGMGIDEALTAYCRILDQVNSSTASEDSETSPRSRSKALEKELKKLVEVVTGDAEGLLLSNISEGGGSKTFVCARNERNLNANIPVLFRSYDTIQSVHTECKIWEAGCATSATPGLFDSIEIGSRGPYVGGSWGASNPTQVVLEEAARVFSTRKIACLVSIGTGHPRTISLSKSPLTEVAMQIAKDCESVHERMLRSFSHQKSLYHRFNVEQGLQMTDHDLLTDSAEVEAHTDAYLSSAVVQLALPDVAKLLVQAPGKVDPNYLLSAPPPLPKGDRLLIRPPPPSPVFIGRKDMLHTIEASLLRTKECNRQKRFVLHGLGGSGKTQIALEFAQLHSSRFTKKYLINASSQQTIDAALENIGLDLGLPEPAASDTLDLLCRLDEDWFLLYDNADDPSVNLHKFFPPCSHGNILITSRNQQSGNYSQPSTSVKEVRGMTTEDSILLLTSLTSRKTLDTENKGLLPSVAEMLGHLALALVQCGSYVASSPGITFRKYMDIFAIRRKDLLSRQSSPPVDLYESTVYTTWAISFEALSDPAKSLLNICSFFHFNGITTSIFSQAALNTLRDEDLRRKCFVSGIEFLSQFTKITVDTDTEPDADEWTDIQSNTDRSDVIETTWDDFPLRETMAELTSYSLMQQNSEGSLSVHPLVQSWCQDLVMREELGTNLRTAQVVLALSAGTERHEDGFIHRQLILPHLNAVLALSSPETVDPDISERFANALRLVGQYHAAAKFWLDIVGQRTAHLGREHPDTLRSMRGLAFTYQKQGRYEEAAEIQLEVIEMRKRLMEPQQLVTLTDMSNLALTYLRQNRYEEARTIQSEVLEARQRILGPTHARTLTSMGDLAVTYMCQGQLKEAEGLQLDVLKIKARTLGLRHPATLKTMNNLALTYSHQGRDEEAQILRLEVLEGRKRALGSTHPSTLMSMYSMARMYTKQGKLDEAAELVSEAMKGLQESLGAEHPRTVLCRKNWEHIQSELSSRALQMERIQSAPETSQKNSNKSWHRWRRIFTKPGTLWGRGNSRKKPNIPQT